MQGLSLWIKIPLFNFFPTPAFLLRIWKRLGCSGLGQVFQCSGNGRPLNFACCEDAKKARNVGHTKAAKLNLWTNLSLLQQNPLFTFLKKKRKKLDFQGGKESSRHKMVSFVHFDRAGTRRRDRPEKNFKRSGPPARCMRISCHDRVKPTVSISVFTDKKLDLVSIENENSKHTIRKECQNDRLIEDQTDVFNTASSINSHL